MDESNVIQFKSPIDEDDFDDDTIWQLTLKGVIEVALVKSLSMDVVPSGVPQALASSIFENILEYSKKLNNGNPGTIDLKEHGGLFISDYD